VNGQLQIARKVLQLPAEGSPDDGFLLLNPQGLITRWNSAAERLLGRTHRQAIGRHPAAVLGDGADTVIGSHHREPAARQGGSPGFWWSAHPDGNRWYDTTTLVPIQHNTRVLGYPLMVQLLPPIQATLDSSEPNGRALAAVRTPLHVVRDYGVGIAADQHANAFGRFERAVHQPGGGFGVGLWIVGTMCAPMGGPVSLESTCGDGACFTVVLRRRQARRPNQPASE